MKKNQRFFVTGTDTEIGKTWVCQQILNHYKTELYTTAALKPIAAGAEQTSEGLRNDDALCLQQAMTHDAPYHHVNPVCFKTPCSPHLAAAIENQTISIPNLIEKSQPLLAADTDLTLIEGAGGWFAPINNSQTMADLAHAYAAPVILVVGIRLGCLNHALLTAKAIEASGCAFHGWVANCLEPNTLFIQENIETLQTRIAAPLLTKKNIMSLSAD